MSKPGKFKKVRDKKPSKRWLPPEVKFRPKQKPQLELEHVLLEPPYGAEIKFGPELELRLEPKQIEEIEVAETEEIEEPVTPTKRGRPKKEQEELVEVEPSTEEEVLEAEEATEQEEENALFGTT